MDEISTTTIETASEAIEKLELQKWMDMGIEMVLQYTPKVVLAFLTLFIGLWISSKISKAILKATQRAGLDAAVGQFLQSFVGISLKVLVFMAVAMSLGVQMTSFMAILGAAGLAIGLALQGSLSNVAGGVLLLVFKPFKLGDFVEVDGRSGVVQKLTIVSTVLKTTDAKIVYLPNGAVSSGAIVNYSAEPFRRVDMVFGIGYGDDIRKAKDLILEIAEADTRILTRPDVPFVAVGNLGDSSVDLTTRVWVATGDYWAVYFDMLENVKVAFDANGISIPFPQRDVHLVAEAGE